MTGRTIWEPGSVVKLKSGGPPMTVGESTTNGDTAWCYWFSGDSPQRWSFPSAGLMKADDEGQYR